jgi:glucose-6-phosphate 1-dehydrogenase
MRGVVSPVEQYPAHPLKTEMSRTRIPIPPSLALALSAQVAEFPSTWIGAVAEVLLHAAMIGNSTRFARQDGIEETWRVMQPLLDSSPPVQAYQPGSWARRSVLT